MNLNDLCAGTRPAVTGGCILMTGSEGFDGYEIMAYKGMVWGVAVRVRDMGQDCAMGCKHFTGGELSSYTSLGDESRQKAIDRLLEMAERLGANGVIDIRFELTGARAGVTEVVVHGTAVVVQPIVNYVPVGAMGNIVAEIADILEKKS